MREGVKTGLRADFINYFDTFYLGDLSFMLFQHDQIDLPWVLQICGAFQ